MGRGEAQSTNLHWVAGVLVPANCSWSHVSYLKYGSIFPDWQEDLKIEIRYLVCKQPARNSSSMYELAFYRALLKESIDNKPCCVPSLY